MAACEYFFSTIYLNLDLIQKIALKTYIVFSFLKDIIENSALCSQEYTIYLFEELLVGGADDDGIGVAHHGDQHVQQQDRDQDLEEDEHQLGHRGVGAFIQLVILTPEQQVRY